MLFSYKCDGCSRHIRGVCAHCMHEMLQDDLPGVPGVLAAVRYDNTARQLVHGLKFYNHRGIAALFAEVMVERLSLNLELANVVTWAPTSKQRAHERGHDQAELIARAVSFRLGVPCRKLLRRTSSISQTGQSRDARLVGPTFVARACNSVGKVLLIDDVVTTGSTLGHAATALREAGAIHVTCAAFAATPAPSERR
jgi:ComF family protein